MYCFEEMKCYPQQKFKCIIQKKNILLWRYSIESGEANIP